MRLVSARTRCRLGARLVLVHLEPHDGSLVLPDAVAIRQRRDHHQAEPPGGAARRDRADLVARPGAFAAAL
jgi:hypothetical protein